MGRGEGGGVEETTATDTSEIKRKIKFKPTGHSGDRGFSNEP